jgi:DNA modification methylase
MREVSFNEYLEYITKHKEIELEDQVISLQPVRIKRLAPESEELTDISTTVWSFPKRGSWATHRGDYRGNWAPQIPRALILMYTKPGDVVLDPMMGSGTTLIEAKLLGRNSIGVDINYNAVILTLHRLYYLEEALKNLYENTSAKIEGVDVEDIKKVWYKVYLGDARKLDLIGDESIDLVATHPPYFNIIKYGGEDRVDGDLSKTRSLEEYLRWMKEIAKEMYRVLKPGKYCAILIGDTRIRKHYVPISHYVMQVFLDAGFVLKEEIIKIQHKMKTTREVWSRLRKRDFLLIYHEKLFVFRKPGSGEEIKDLEYSKRPDFLKLEI